ncbi:hypothetical protein GMDG_01448 [Pseudogymnoascus destructans 20631-21]|uniref:Uncharacterized protein n=1 Tax=Pseudogymnoascus destructans (strain ATCC MYA-4855 / 20631-21) TaxID=658429 RepID=L8FUE3_PSED2|nr:hypothetical protein GMDG_01448 [Pseudogymnoascus destructans 20631-21]
MVPRPPAPDRIGCAVFSYAAHDFHCPGYSLAFGLSTVTLDQAGSRSLRKTWGVTEFGSASRVENILVYTKAPLASRMWLSCACFTRAMPIQYLLFGFRRVLGERLSNLIQVLQGVRVRLAL